MPRSIFRKALFDQRWMILGFGASLAVMAMLTVYIWPSYRDTLQNFEIPPALEGFLGELSIATPAGFLSAEFYSWMPILLMVFAVIQGTGALAGEEGAGTMDLLLAQPVTRRRVVLEKVGASVLGAVLIVAIGYLGWLLAIPFVDMEGITLWDVFVANVNLLPITLLFFAIALFAGAVAPSRAVAAAVVIGLITAAYFAQIVVNSVEAFDLLKYATPFYYYGNGLPLVRGLEWAHVGLLLGVAAVFLALSVRMFENRDIATGRGEFSLTGWTKRRSIASEQQAAAR